MIAVLNFGMGNLRSVEKALQRVGAEVEVTSDPDRARAADGVVLPGVGAFPEAMRRLRKLGLEQAIDEAVRSRIPVMGICLGMQLLFERSSEQGGAAGLGILAGQVRELEAPGLKLPHIGWEEVRWERRSRLLPGTAPGAAFYFVHSFAPHVARAEDVLGTAVHGSAFACAVERERVWGLQFHPEKSSAAGLRLLANFAGACVPVGA